MSDLQYILFYEIYIAILVIGGLIWLKNTNSPGSKRLVHHYQVGLIVLIITIPLVIFIIITDDTLGKWLLIPIILLGLGGILLDWADFVKGRRKFARQSHKQRKKAVMMKFKA